MFDDLDNINEIELYNIDDEDFNYFNFFSIDNKIIFKSTTDIIKCINSANYLDYEKYFDFCIKILANKIIDQEFKEYNILSEDIKYSLIKYLDYETINNLNINIDKNNIIYLNKYREYLIKKKNFPHFILDNIIDEKLFLLKEMCIDGELGATGYIDFINYKYFDGNNIAYGHDRYNRFFISILYDIDSFKSKNNVITLFQRYSYNEYFYVTGGDDLSIGEQTYDFKNYKICNQVIKDFFDLINKNEIEIMKYNYEKHDELLTNNISILTKITLSNNN